MSMVTEYVRLRPYELSELRRLLVDDPDEAYEYAGDLRSGDPYEEVSTRGVDIDTAWGGLQYLLAKAGAPVDVVGGGVPLTDDEWGFDSPRLLSSEAVAEAARFLVATPFPVLAQRYDPAQLTAAAVYPSMWDEEWALSYLEKHYERLVALFHAAALDGEPVLVWLA